MEKVNIETNEETSEEERAPAHGVKPRGRQGVAATDERGKEMKGEEKEGKEGGRKGRKRRGKKRKKMKERKGEGTKGGSDGGKVGRTRIHLRMASSREAAREWPRPTKAASIPDLASSAIWLEERVVSDSDFHKKKQKKAKKRNK